MKTSLVQIGNSRGVRIPKVLIEQAGLQDEVEMQVRGSQVIIQPVNPSPRTGWDEAFAQMAKRGDDGLIDTPAPTWNETEWVW